MNEEKFSGKEKIYASARPDYSTELFEYLKANNIVGNDMTVADIGAGTGIFTRQISKYVKKVYAVEPNDGMREQGIKNNCYSKNVTFINGTAENTEIESKAIDVVTAAQAFHWFDKSAFKNECRRILKPDGKIILVWNDRNENAQIIADNFEINKLYCKDFHGFSNGMSFEKESFGDFFDGEFELLNFENDFEYDMSGFIARSLSSSYAPKENEQNYASYVKALRTLFLKSELGGKVKYPYVTKCFIGRV